MKANSIQCSMQAHMHIFNRIATKNLKSISKKKTFINVILVFSKCNLLDCALFLTYKKNIPG